MVTEVKSDFLCGGDWCLRVGGRNATKDADNVLSYIFFKLMKTFYNIYKHGLFYLYKHFIILETYASSTKIEDIYFIDR